MLKYLGLLSLLGLLLSGCAHMYRVRPQTPPAALDRMNRELLQASGKLVLRSGDELRGQGFQIRPDSTLWLPAPGSLRQATANRDVRSLDALVRVPFDWQGIRAGAVWGGITGGLAGSALGLMAWSLTSSRVYDEPPPPDSLYHPSYGSHNDRREARWYPVVGLLAGTVLGATVGGTLGFLIVSIDARAGRPVQVRFSYPLHKP